MYKKTKRHRWSDEVIADFVFRLIYVCVMKKI